MPPLFCSLQRTNRLVCIGGVKLEGLDRVSFDAIIRASHHIDWNYRRVILELCSVRANLPIMLYAYWGQEFDLSLHHVTSSITWPFNPHGPFPIGGPLEPSLYLYRLTVSCRITSIDIKNHRRCTGARICRRLAPGATRNKLTTSLSSIYSRHFVIHQIRCRWAYFTSSQTRLVYNFVKQRFSQSVPPLWLSSETFFLSSYTL